MLDSVILIVGIAILAIFFVLSWDMGGKYPPAKITSREIYFDLMLFMMPMTIGLLSIMHAYTLGKMPLASSDSSRVIFLLAGIVLAGIGIWGYQRAEQKRKKRG